MVTSKFFLSRYGKKFQKNFKNPIVGFANPFFLLSGGKNL
jgi:hypothetical protein